MRVDSETAPEPVGPYPHARKVPPFLFLSGVGPRQRGQKDIPGVYQDAEGNVVGHDIEVQTRACIENVQKVLQSCGCDLEDVIDVQVFLTDMASDFQRFNKIYGEFFADIGPTRTTIEVSSLPTPIAVELKVIAKL